MGFDQIGLQRAADDEYVILLKDSQLRNPFLKNFDPLSRDDTLSKLRELGLREDEILGLFARAEGGSPES